MADPELVEKLASIVGAHMKAELAGDRGRTLTTMSPDPHVVNVPTMIEGPEGSRPQANVLVQIGLLDPACLPVTGAGAAVKLGNP